MKIFKIPAWLEFVLEYETAKNVSIPNYKIGALYRVLQLLLLAYVVCWIILYEKSYQVTDDAVTNVFTKLKGVGFTNLSGNPIYGTRVWDIHDLVMPPMESNALFVSTNIIVTPHQKLSTCPENLDLKAARCKFDADCPIGHLNHFGNGAYTGKCVSVAGTGTCEIYSWCPLENDTLPLGYDQSMFPMVENFTIFIKAQAAFQEFGIYRRNILKWATKDFLRNCLYDGEDEKLKYCPIFKISKIFEEAGVDSKMLILGGVIGIYINWDCDFDWDQEYCKPEYSFVQLHEDNATIAPGFNYRFARYYYVNGTQYRDLYKVYGIRFIIQAHGVAGKFHLLPLTLALGAGLEALGLSSIICDLILTKLIRARNFYDERTTERVLPDQEAEYLRELQSDKTGQSAPEGK